MTKEKPENVKAYIAQFPNKMQQKLQEVLACLKEFVPEAEISLKWAPLHLRIEEYCLQLLRLNSLLIFILLLQRFVRSRKS